LWVWVICSSLLFDGIIYEQLSFSAPLQKLYLNLRKRAEARFLYYKPRGHKLLKKHQKKRRAKTTILDGKSISNEHMRKIVALVRDLAEPICQSEGMELIHVEYGPEKGGKTMRLYIDKPDGVTLDDCAAISHQVGDIIDVNLEESGSYHLEVSSPGPERPLGKMADFERFKGNVVKIRTAQPINGQRNFKGILSGISKGKVIICLEHETVAISFQDITKARLAKNGEI
jgi:ribosome maturation factor RimP